MLYKNSILKNKKFDVEKLEKYGFSSCSEYYKFETDILKNSFHLMVKIFPDNSVDTRLIEKETNDDYNLIYVLDAEGEFIGTVKAEFEKVLSDIIENCTFANIFKTRDANEIIEYIKAKYNDEAEYFL